MKTAVAKDCEFRAGSDLKRGFSPDIGQPFGGNAARQIKAGRERPPRGQRVLDAPSGARAGGRVLAASGTFNRLSLKDEIWSTAAMIP
jgi:hypothetical protein